MKRLLNIISQMPGDPEDHLFHGTIVDYKEAILALGIGPRTGDFISDVYEDKRESIDEYTYAADIDGLEKCAAAIIGQIAHKYKDGDYKEVDEEDIKNYGVLFVIKRGKSNAIMDYYPGSYLSDWEENEEYPVGVEPGDYYSKEFISVTDYIEGQELVDLFNKHNVLLPIFREIYINW